MEQAALSATSASNYASNASAEADNSAESAGLAANSAAAAAESEGKAAEYLQQVSDKITVIEGSIGDIGFAPLGIDEAQNKRRYLNGQVISQAQFVSFTNKLKSIIQTYPSLAVSETNWQAEVTNSKLGQCGKFVIDDTAGTIRLPKVVNIQGLQDLSLLGGIKAESLPNITGTFYSWDGNQTGAFYKKQERNAAGSPTAQQSAINGFDASRSNSAYQDGAPVQQEAIQYPYFIQVATGVEESVDVTREIELNNPFSLLDYKWSEYELSNASWLLSNGAFHSGATYPAVYELLLKIKNGTETKDGVSVKLSTESYTDTDFVINTANMTFRLPIKVKLASGNRVAGNGMTLGLQQGNKNAGAMVSGAGVDYRDDIYGTPTNTASYGATNFQTASIGITTDPTKSGIETSSSGLKLYFYVGETVQDANLINAGKALEQLGQKVDAQTAAWAASPSDRHINLTLNASGTVYTAPANGWITLAKSSTAANQYLAIEGKLKIRVDVPNSSTNCEASLPVSRGDKVTVFYTLAGTTYVFRFTYASGEK